MNWTKATIQELCAVIMGGEATEEEYEAAGAELFRRIGGEHELQGAKMQTCSNRDMGNSAGM